MGAADTVMFWSEFAGPGYVRFAKGNSRLGLAAGAVLTSVGQSASQVLARKAPWDDTDAISPRSRHLLRRTASAFVRPLSSDSDTKQNKAEEKQGRGWHKKTEEPTQ